jgi:hypothetical protein
MLWSYHRDVPNNVILLLSLIFFFNYLFIYLLFSNYFLIKTEKLRIKVTKKDVVELDRKWKEKK